MTLLSPAPSERLRRMRHQGVGHPCARKKEIASDVPHIHPLSRPQYVFFALMYTKERGSSANLSCFHAERLGGICSDPWCSCIKTQQTRCDWNLRGWSRGCICSTDIFAIYRRYCSCIKRWSHLLVFKLLQLIYQYWQRLCILWEAVRWNLF